MPLVRYLPSVQNKLNIPVTQQEDANKHFSSLGIQAASKYMEILLLSIFIGELQIKTIVWFYFSSNMMSIGKKNKLIREKNRTFIDCWWEYGKGVSLSEKQHNSFSEVFNKISTLPNRSAPWYILKKIKMFVYTRVDHSC